MRLPWKSESPDALNTDAVRNARRCADEADKRLQAAVESESAVQAVVNDLRTLRTSVTSGDLRIVRRKTA